MQSTSELTLFSCPKVLKKLSQALVVPRGGGGAGGLAPKFHNSAKIDKEKWHKIS